MYKKNNEKGQILLIVVITMIVALTVGLSIASRTVTELRLSRQNEESQRAFNAAEAGIDRALQQQVLQDGGAIDALPGLLGNNSEFLVSATPYDGSQILLNNGEDVDQDIGADVWLSNYPDFSGQIVSGRLVIYWGDEDQSSCTESDIVRPALEIALMQGNIANPQIVKYLYDTCSGRTQGTLDGATLGSQTVDGIPGYTFTNRIATPIQITNGIIMKIIPLYNSTVVAIVAENLSGQPIALPSQGSVIESTGTSGETVRRITYYQSYPQMPIELFPYSIISQ